jgi:PLP dependent protein
MHESINRLLSIEKEIQLEKSNSKKSFLPNIIAVSKTFPINEILPLINHGHIHFGENKVQEANEKWADILNDFKHLKLHMIGKLQTNKVKMVIPIFDYIHSLDNLKLAEKISNEQLKKNKILKIFIQVNVGNENQKSGIEVDKLENFYKICTENLGLNIIGLMCLPPINIVDDKYFILMKKLSDNLKLKNLSMGMSNDYLNAYKNGATYLRIGSKIFGERT